MLCKLLEFLVDHNRIAVKRGAPEPSREALKERLRRAVARWYPYGEHQTQIPEEERFCDVSQYIAQELSADSNTESSKRPRTSLLKEKSATPGDGDHDPNDDILQTRPCTVNPGVSTKAFSDPAAMRTASLIQYGDPKTTAAPVKNPAENPLDASLRDGKLSISTKSAPIDQWHGKYFSQILPFVIPFLVSGPDYIFYNKRVRWRRKDMEDEPEAPWVCLLYTSPSPRD